ncbi:pseudouridine synthase [Litorimonas cladophorae]|uniref:Pseudouridine synthase n=1 Tax=Litorimonas cladophorae TaxID=1220491 RepID=A0A918KFF7_9PROT|nr:RluA family pseudouridine synthase [Litorimonas cladophorae]GGX59122.1 pseudouridine synthase [Litorimonas cladophorae]
MSDEIGKWDARTAEIADGGQRLDKWLATWTGLSRSRIKDLVETGHVRADGDLLGKVTAKVRADVEYAVRVPPPVDDTPLPENIPLDILFEDDHLIVLNKPAGMTVHPAPGSRSATLVNALLFHCAGSLSGIGGVMRPGIVHRLDKDTSGVMVAAKSDKAHQGLSKQFAKHSIDRIYTCLVRGMPKPRSGSIASRLARSPNDRKKQSVVRGTYGDIDASEVGRHAITHYRYVKGFGRAKHTSIGTPKVSQLDCQLETGRTHQIRVHLAHIACPLLGDPLYGKQRAYALSNHPAEEAVRIAVAAFKRQALHARHLGFIHPVTKEHMSFDAPLPPDMQHLLDVLTDLPVT